MMLVVERRRMFPAATVPVSEPPSQPPHNSPCCTLHQAQLCLPDEDDHLDQSRVEPVLEQLRDESPPDECTCQRSS